MSSFSRPLAPASPDTRVRGVVLAGVFTALTILFTRVFAIQTPLVHFGFGFLSLGIYAAIAGPWRAAAVAVLADFVGVNLLGTGAYFPGFSVSAAVTGALYGLAFHQKKITLPRVAVTFFLVAVLVGVLLNTFWLTLLMEKGAIPILLARVPKIFLCYPFEVALFLAACRATERFWRR